MRDGNRINVVHMEGFNVVLCVYTHTEYRLYHCHSGIDESGMDTYTPGYRVRMEQRLVSPAASCRVAQLDGTGKWGEFTYETSLTKQFSAFWGLGIKVMKCIRGCHQTLAKLILVCSTPCLEVPATMNSTSETRLYVTRFRHASGMGNNWI